MLFLFYGFKRSNAILNFVVSTPHHAYCEFDLTYSRTVKFHNHHLVKFLLVLGFAILWDSSDEFSIGKDSIQLKNGKG